MLGAATARGAATRLRTARPRRCDVSFRIRQNPKPRTCSNSFLDIHSFQIFVFHTQLAAAPLSSAQCFGSLSIEMHLAQRGSGCLAPARRATAFKPVAACSGIKRSSATRRASKLLVHAEKSNGSGGGGDNNAKSKRCERGQTLMQHETRPSRSAWMPRTRVDCCGEASTTLQSACWRNNMRGAQARARARALRRRRRCCAAACCGGSCEHSLAMWCNTAGPSSWRH